MAEDARPPKAESKKGTKEDAALRKPAATAQVLNLLGRTGATGNIYQVRVRVLDGYDKGKIMRRNVLGPIRVNDLLMLSNTEVEASKLRSV